MRGEGNSLKLHFSSRRTRFFLRRNQIHNRNGGVILLQGLAQLDCRLVLIFPCGKLSGVSRYSHSDQSTWLDMHMKTLQPTVSNDRRRCQTPDLSILVNEDMYCLYKSFYQWIRFSLLILLNLNLGSHVLILVQRHPTASPRT